MYPFNGKLMMKKIILMIRHDCCCWQTCLICNYWCTLTSKGKFCTYRRSIMLFTVWRWGARKDVWTYYGRGSDLVVAFWWLGKINLLVETTMVNLEDCFDGLEPWTCLIKNKYQEWERTKDLKTVKWCEDHCIIWECCSWWS